MGFKLVEDPHTRERIETYFKNSIYPVITENNWKQALIPEGCKVLDNHNGTAPDSFWKRQERQRFSFPAFNELKPLFLDAVSPYLQELQPEVIRSQMIKICGHGESQVADQIKDLIAAQTNPTIAPYAKTAEVHLRVTTARPMTRRPRV